MVADIDSLQAKGKYFQVLGANIHKIIPFEGFIELEVNGFVREVVTIVCGNLALQKPVKSCTRLHAFY